MLDMLATVWDLVEGLIMLILNIVAVAYGLLVFYVLFSRLIGEYWEGRKRSDPSR